MTVGVRRVLFVLFAASFCVLAPLIVLYTAGYRFSLQKGFDLKVGSLSITAIPAKVSVGLNGSIFKQKTPRVYKQLSPGTYKVDLSRSGYLPWSGQIKVLPGLTSYIEHVELFLKSNPKFIADLPNNSAASNTGEYLTYTATTGDNTDFILYNLYKARTTTITHLTKPKNLSAAWTKDDEYFFLAHDSSLEIYKYNGNKVSSIDQLDLTASTVSWNPLNSNLIDIATGEKTIEYNIAQNSLSELPVASLLRLNSGAVLHLRNVPARTILLSSNGDQDQEILSLPRSSYTLLSTDNNQLVLQDSQKDLVFIGLNDWQIVSLPGPINEVIAHPENGSFLYSNGYEIGQVTPGQIQREIATRLSQQIKKALWHPSGQSLIYATSGQIFATDAFQYTLKRNTVELGKFETIDNLWTNKNGKILYVLGSMNDQKGLFSLALH